MRVFDLFTEDKASDIKLLQQLLNQKGASIKVDGVIGKETLLAILKYAPNTLPPDIKNKLEKVDSSQKKGSSNRANLGKNAFKDTEFNEKLNQVAKKLGILPETLRAIIYTESKGNPTARDPYNVSAGLIGFTRSTAKKLGTTREEILQMSAVDQLDLVYDYYRKVGVRPGMSRGDIYMLTFLPAFVNAPDDFVLGQEGGDELRLPGGKSSGLSKHKIWYQNPVFGRSRGRNYFTAGDVRRHVNSVPVPDIDESINEDEVNPVDSIELDVPLLIRMLEYAREDAQTDMDLHNVAEKMISLSQTGERLSMNDYDQIVSNDGPVEEAEWTVPIGGLSQKQDPATGHTTTRYQAGPLYMTQQVDAQGKPIKSTAKYNLGPATLGAEQDHVSGIRTATATPADPNADPNNLFPTKNIAAARGVDPKKFAQFQKQLPAQEAMGGASAEEFLKSVEYRSQSKPKAKTSLMGRPMREGHGRYWCSTDKRWKERQGPKQSRG